MERDLIRRQLLFFFTVFFCSLVSVCNARAAGLSQSVSLFNKKISDLNANVIFVRHTLAPGVGDPISFNIDDCSTQRNLNQTGKMQANDLGNFFLQSELQFDEILSSEWCRCKETAALLNLGRWTVFSGLNSFFDGHVDKILTLRILNNKLDNLKLDSLVLLITHQVVISSITGRSVPSGGIVIYNSKSADSEYILWKQ